MEKEKEHEIELFNSIKRSEAIKELELEEFKRQIAELKDLIEREKRVSIEKEDNNRLEMEESLKKFEEEKKRIIEEKNQHQKKVSELSIKLR